MKQVQAIVVGGGCIGLSAALGLANLGKKVLLIDAGKSAQVDSDEFGLRVSAISKASQALFEKLGIWQGIEAQRLAAYTNMDVRDKDSIGRIHFASNELDLSELGHIVENEVIRQALITQCEKNDNLEILFETPYSSIHQTDEQVLVTLASGEPVMAELLIACDGANSAIRSQFKMPITFWDYDHHAIVATVKSQVPHVNTARQVFLPTGPLAFLPLPEQNTHSIVWSTSPEHAKQLVAMEEGEFNKALTAAFDSELGLCAVESQRLSFPLKMRYARKWVENRVILMGDAAHTIHPLAGLGMNLGLKDVAKLLQLVADDQSNVFANGKLLRQYEMARKADAQTHIAMMQGLKELFDGSNPVKKLIRGIGLNVVDAAKPIKHLFAEKALQ
ncbi:FAD-dependent monooxygenase [Pseudoalteromonas spongiae]|uniref:FAD-dependent monooxygenase n=1 Tax=Pseudoalteromonas spongiae TaxID=298657 RepID=UPI00110B9FD9|nr:FAD-dependent monooxygenase [Pseudoalteromonas spongiae]TMO82471.1 monooxygenase [Pseudoalteromonas spongiae]